jgi:serine/threonine protein kinase
MRWLFSIVSVPVVFSAAPSHFKKSPKSVARYSSGSDEPEPYDKCFSPNPLITAGLDIVNTPPMATDHIPETNKEAESIYLGDAFGFCDRFGRSRAIPHFQLWETFFEIIPEYIFGLSPSYDLPDIPVGGEIVQLGKSLGTTPFSMIYELNRGGIPTSMAIKYQAFHDAVDSTGDHEDSIPREAFFLGLLGGSGIANEVLYSSKRMDVSETEYLEMLTVASPKLNPNVIHDYRVSSGERLFIRYLITEKVGESLYHFLLMQSPPKRVVPFSQVIDLGLGATLLLKRLHAKNIVHGDIHPGNVAFKFPLREKPYGDNRLVLIDFGRARIGPQQGGEEPVVLDTVKNCHEYFSQWEIFNMAPSYRDDMYRLMSLMAMLAHGRSYAVHLGKACLLDTDERGEPIIAEEENFLDNKLRSNLFDVEMNIPYNPTRTYSLKTLLQGTQYSDVSGQISQIFHQIMSHIRSLREAEKPDYNLVISHLAAIQSLV